MQVWLSRRFSHKADKIGLIEKIGIDAIIKEYKSNPSKYFSLEKARESVCRQFLIENGYDNLLNIIESSFKNVSYFSMSGMGHDEMEENSYVPFGVIEPFLWITSMTRSKMGSTLLNIIRQTSCDCFQSESRLPLLISKYEFAHELDEKKMYIEAISEYEKLGSFRDSQYQISKIMRKRYQNAIDLLNAGKYDQAIEQFSLLNGYMQSDDYIKQALYKKGCDLLTIGKYDDAQKVFVNLGSFSDSKKRLTDISIMQIKNGKTTGILEYSAPVEHPGRLRLNTRTCGQLFGPKHISRFLGAEANQAPPKAACS